MLKISIMEDKVKKPIALEIKRLVDQEVTGIVDKVNRKSVIYVLWSVFGIALIATDSVLPRLVFYTLFFMMMMVMGYFLLEFIKSLKGFLVFVNNFENWIKNLVEKEKQKAMDESVINKLGFLLSGQSNRDLEDFCISCSVRELFKRFGQKKRMIILRIAVYTITVILLREVLNDILLSL